MRRFVRHRQHVQGMCRNNYELWCGQAPNTAESLITASADYVEMPASISSKDHETVETIAQQCESLVQYLLELRDEKARASNMRRDIAEGVAPQVTRFDIRVEDQASSDDHKVILVELTGADGLSQTAAIKMASGEMKTMQYRQLRPLVVG